jgi:hypothetical protein
MTKSFYYTEFSVRSADQPEPYGVVIVQRNKKTCRRKKLPEWFTSYDYRNTADIITSRELYWANNEKLENIKLLGKLRKI